jgi:branched-chain amino acid transport system substrate-binding protein
MNTKKIILIIVALIVVIGLIISNSSSEVYDVKIGAVLSLSGPAAIDGENIRSGIEFAKLNLERQGINLEVIYENDETESSKTVSAVKKISSIDNVDAMVGPTWSFLASAAAETIKNEKIVSFNPANTSEYVEGSNEYFIFGSPKNSLKADPVANWLKEIGAKKVAIAVLQGTWGDSHIPPFEEAIRSVDGELVLTERIPFGATGTDIQTVIAKIIVTGADAVLFTGFDESTALMVNKKKDMMAEFALLDAGNISKKQDEQGKVNINPEDEVYAIIPTTSQKFEDAYKKEYGILPGAYVDRAYDGTMMLAKAISEKPENVELKEYIKEMNYEGYMGTYNFDENNDVIGGEWVIEQIK